MFNGTVIVGERSKTLPPAVAEMLLEQSTKRNSQMLFANSPAAAGLWNRYLEMKKSFSKSGPLQTASKSCWWPCNSKKKQKVWTIVHRSMKCIDVQKIKNKAYFKALLVFSTQKTKVPGSFRQEILQNDGLFQGPRSMASHHFIKESFKMGHVSKLGTQKKNAFRNCWKSPKTSKLSKIQVPEVWDIPKSQRTSPSVTPGVGDDSVFDALVLWPRQKPRISSQRMWP